MDAEKLGFTHGAIWAIAELIRQAEEGHAELLWHAGGFTSDDINLCDACDSKEVRRYLKEWEK